MKRSKNATVSNLIWFEIPADQPERAQKFYKALFGWKIEPSPVMADYWHIDTDGDDMPNGGILTRKHPPQPMINSVNVASVTNAVKKVEKLGGTVCKGKFAVPPVGCFAICRDTENNEFILWEINLNAK